MKETFIPHAELFQLKQGIALRIEDLERSISLAKTVDSDTTYWEECLANAKNVQKHLFSSFCVVIK